MEILIPDLKATKIVDYLWLQLKRTERNAEFVLASELKIEKDWTKDEIKEARKAHEDDKKEATKLLKKTKKALDEYESKEATPQIVIGCVPPRKLTSLRHGRFVLGRNKFNIETATQEELDAWSESAREWLRWGVKDVLNFGFDYESEKEKCGPVSYDVATWETVEVLEGTGLLDTLFLEIVAFNALDESKKKTSL